MLAKSAKWKYLTKFKQVVKYCLVLFLVGLFIANVLFPNRFYELNVLIHKYTDLNIRQNTGLHKYTLIFIRKMTIFLPSVDEIEIEREFMQVGVVDPESVNQEVGQVVSERYYIDNEERFLKVLRTAKAGSVITLMPGEYHIVKSKIEIGFPGEVYKPITVRASNYGDVKLRLGTKQGFLVNKPFWVFENLIIEGECTHDSWCDHAFHLVGNADYTVIRNNHVKNFNAHIKSNGYRESKQSSKRIFPNYVTIQNNTLINEWKRNTINSVTPIDIVGGEHWKIKHNFIADFGKYGRKGRGVTYGAYLKGDGKYGVMEENLVACAWRLPHTSTTDIRIGLSLGGGGTGPQFCHNGICEQEHEGGIIRNNIIVNCFNDVGIYLNKARNSMVYGNHVLSSVGIDLRFPQTSAEIFNNKIDGRVRTRNGATLVE